MGILDSAVKRKRGEKADSGYLQESTALGKLWSTVLQAAINSFEVDPHAFTIIEHGENFCRKIYPFNQADALYGSLTKTCQSGLGPISVVRRG